MKKITLAVIFGGQSSEHEVSLSSASGVIGALDENKYEIVHIAITKSGNWLIGEKGEEYLKKYKSYAGKENSLSAKESDSLTSSEDISIFEYCMKNKIDIIFPILHGPYGEDGKIQGLLDMIGLPYVFSGVLANALSMRKEKAKMIVENAGVTVAKDCLIDENYNIKDILNNVSLPLVVKPIELGSSVGVSITRDEKSLEEGIKTALKYGKKVLLEEYVKGREFAVTVMGNENPKALAVTEIIPKISEFYDYKAKYEEGGSEHVCPANIPEHICQELEKSSVSAYSSLGCRDVARADFIWGKDGKMYFIEMNTIPGMTPTSLVPEAAKASGMSFEKFLDQLISFALERK